MTARIELEDGSCVIKDVSLADATETIVAHGLGRPLRAVFPSTPRGALSAGRIQEVRPAGIDCTKYVVLQADGWGATITVDLMVV